RNLGLDAETEIAAVPELAEIVELIGDGAFSPDDPGRFKSLADGLRYLDRYMVSVDFAAYREAQAKVDRLWQHSRDWGRAVMHNIAHVGWFSADRTIAEYAGEIWHVPLQPG